MTRNRRFARTGVAGPYAGYAPSTFEKMRLTGEGPPYRKVGRLVIYDLDEVDSWLDSGLRQSTSDTGSETRFERQSAVSRGESRSNPPIGRRREARPTPPRGVGGS